MKIKKYVTSPMRLFVRYAANLLGSFDQLAASFLGFNKDWTISAAAGWLEYIDWAVAKLPLGFIIANLINLLVWVPTQIGYLFSVTDEHGWQHCRRAYLADQHEHPYHVIVEAWDCIMDD